MSLKPFASLSLDQLVANAQQNPLDWLWDGYLSRGNLTILTSVWKAGKTTLLAGLLQRLATGGEFLGQACRPVRTTVVSEEAPMHWTERLKLMPINGHVQLLLRPFVGRPTFDQWSELIEQMMMERKADELDLFVVDTLASFFPGGSEASPSSWLTMLAPLQQLAAAGVAVLLMHHPRKEKSAEGNSARGSGALLSYVDVILELHRYGRNQRDERRRRLVGISRHVQTPKCIVYEWERDSGQFTNLGDPVGLRFRDNWQRLSEILQVMPQPLTVPELRALWPTDDDKPAASQLHEWLMRAHAEGLVERRGEGKKGCPFRWGVGVED